MTRIASMPVPIVGAMVASIQATAALWVSPVVGLALAAAVVAARAGLEGAVCTRDARPVVCARARRAR